MTVILAQLVTTSVGGRVPADGMLRWERTARTVDGDVVIIPGLGAARLVEGEAVLDLEPGPYRFIEPDGGAAWRYVPEVGPVTYASLAAVDPATLEPTAEPAAAWYAALDTLETTTAGALLAAEGARDAAEGSLSAAVTAQGSAQNSATAADGSAQLAAGHAATAGARAGDAATSAQAAAGHASAAQGSAVSAAGDADLAEAARAEAEALRGDVLTARATMVTGGAVDANGRLILSRVDAPQLDAGDVLGPPLVARVVGTTTGPDTPGTPGPGGLKGDKGDPGGIVVTLITSGQDLDAFTTSGVYACNNGTFATLALHYPNAGKAGVLYVHRIHSTFFHQIYYAADTFGRATYERTNTGGAWGPWYFRGAQRVDQSAGRAIYQFDDVNNREQLVWGDTGLRSLTLDNGYSGSLYVRRQGGVVNITGTVIRPPGVSLNGVWLAAIPAGFRPHNTAWVYFPMRHNGSNAFFSIYRKNTELSFTDATGDSDSTQVRFDVSWQTADPWPTTLPGAAFGTIPNA